MKQFERFGVDHAAFDDIVTSGEAAREYLAARPGTRAFFVGAERDRGVFDGTGIELTDENEAALIACAGLFDDDRETPEDYAERMRGWVARGLPFVCANPDKVVERGDRIVWCAGALAEKYASLGGETIILGKPHAPIYATAMRRFAELAGGAVDPATVLAIGDAAETDLRGANDAGLDVLFVTAGIHAERVRRPPRAGRGGGRRLPRRASPRRPRLYPPPRLVAVPASRLDRRKARRQGRGPLKPTKLRHA